MSDKKIVLLCFTLVIGLFWCNNLPHPYFVLPYLPPPPPLQMKSFKDYVELYVRGVSSDEEEDELPRKIVHEVVNPRWEVAVTASPGGGFQQASFVNSIATTKVGPEIIIQLISAAFEHSVLHV